MHMANELLSIPVAMGSCAAAAGMLGLICHKAKSIIMSEKLAMMGILGAFVFAAQMVNFQLPFMPGTSGHLVGAVLLAIVLGPSAATIVMSSVVIVQCLIFQDGGILALGCNIINMAIVPSFLGYYIYRLFITPRQSQLLLYLGSIIACVTALLAGAILVTVQAAISGILQVPFSTFLTTMLSVHIIIGIMEGLITAAVLVYLRQVRPEMIADCTLASARLSRNAVYISLLLISVIVAAGLSHLASSKPDGLEWSYAERPDQPEFKTIVSNESKMIASVDDFQSRYSPLPDYTIRATSLGTIAGNDDFEPGHGWASFAGVAGSVVTMMVIYLTGCAFRGRGSYQNAPSSN